MKSNYLKFLGFTLIELMIVITVIFVLSGMSLVAYFRFNDKQEALADARNFMTISRKVQSMSKNLVFPLGCSGLQGYTLESDCSDGSCQSMSAKAVCTSGEYDIFSNEKVLDTDTFDELVSLFFEAGTGKITPSGDYSLMSEDNPYQVVVSIDDNGNINIHEP